MQQLARTGKWLLAVMLAVASTSACGDDDDSSPGSAGRGGTVGNGGKSGGDKGGAGAASETVGGGGDASGGSAPEAECNTDVACGFSVISFLECPSRLEDLDLHCESGIRIERYMGCDGSVVEIDGGAQTMRYTFDADGKLVGTRDIGDVGDQDCFGQPCDDVGPAEILCDGSAGAGPDPGGAGGMGGDGVGGAGGANTGGMP